MTAETTLLEDDVIRHLVRRGLAPSVEDLRGEVLTGGVSNDVLAVTGKGLNLVVKRALGRLRVTQDWEADTARLVTEGLALREAAAVIPGAVPEVVDAADGFLAMERAPDDWRTWKADLMQGRVDTAIAHRLGHLLATLQRDTSSRLSGLSPAFADRTAFEQLRTTPFHRQIRDVHPELVPAIDRTLAHMSTRTDCLVHGDYTPKNILVGQSAAEVWIIDWEVAHLGDATFDPAWTVGHLLLKSLHRPQDAAAFHSAAAEFLAGHAEVRGAPDLDPDQLLRQTGCLLLARADGRSPVEYLDDAGRDRARIAGRLALTSNAKTPLDLWKDII
ncbi:phosphotransferase [Citricoccus sp.]|uniref:phosphotransferase family protein n=1 Tax=Citricoccus sp. TaxID=1978372 RepID=UPI0028BDB222|nr:phosphotransferase [Citricoccus sp.]